MPRLYIVGMPGSGKSTIGKLLAKKIDLTFFDLDELIVQKEKKSIPDIFEQEGESYFRQVESEELQEITHQNESFVLATGGGAPCYHNGIEWMNKYGTTVFIDVSPEILVKRVSEQGERPLLKEDPSGRIKKLYEERHPTYQKAQLHIKADNLAVEEVVQQIARVM